MNWRRIAVGTVVLGVVGNAIDYVLNTWLLTDVMASMSAIARPEVNVPMYVLGDFIAAFMLMLAWDLVGDRFGRGAKAGASFGLAAGLFVTFPMFHFWYLQVRDIPYSTIWIMIIVVTCWYAILGTVAAALDREPARAAAG